MKNWFNTYIQIFCGFSDFDDRSHRLEIWNDLINNIIVGCLLAFLTGPFVWIFNIVAFIASIGLTVRRFHDIALNGWFLTGLFIPVLNLFFLVMRYFFKSNPGANPYGPNPYGKSRKNRNGTTF